jgi:hypothetical protein
VLRRFSASQVGSNAQRDSQGEFVHAFLLSADF